MRLCPPTSMCSTSGCDIFMSSAHMYCIFWIFMAAYLSFLCQCLLSVKLCMNARVCHLTSYSVVQLRGSQLPSNTGLYDRARPGASSHPSLPRRV